MQTLLFVSAAVWTLSSALIPVKPILGMSFVLVLDMFDELVKRADQLPEDLAALSTLCQIGANRLKHIEDIGLPSLTLTDDKQEESISTFKDQVQSLFHGAADVTAQCDETKSLADSNSGILAGLDAALAAVGGVDGDQDTEINDLNEEADEVKEALLERLDDVITGLEGGLANATLNVEEVQDFVDNKTCEYGLTTACPGQSINVTFKTEFEDVPDISLGMAGLAVHLDRPGGNFLSYEIVHTTLNITRNIELVSEQGFVIVLGESDDQSVHLKHVYYSWMACQNFGERFSPSVEWS